MTAIAMLFFMLVSQLEPGLHVVIKTPDLPAIGGVALLTVLTQFTLMLVIRFVTGKAFYRSILVAGRQMAFFTGDYRMKPNERETGDVMFKAYFGLPAFNVMTFIAFLALLSFMWIVQPMAGITVRFHFRLEYILFMTGSTLNFFVSAK